MTLWQCICAVLQNILMLAIMSLTAQYGCQGSGRILTGKHCPQMDERRHSDCSKSCSVVAVCALDVCEWLLFSVISSIGQEAFWISNHTLTLHQVSSYASAVFFLPCCSFLLFVSWSMTWFCSRCVNVDMHRTSPWECDETFPGVYVVVLHVCASCFVS